MAKILFKPFSAGLRMIAGRIATKTSQASWQGRHGTEPPGPTTEQATCGQVVGSAVFQATVFAATNAIAQWMGAKAVKNVTGFWPGDEHVQPARRLSASSKAANGRGRR
ncbi:MAG: DUF4235 domain-containing protein [Solirubrobacteraceae bacterium]